MIVSPAALNSPTSLGALNRPSAELGAGRVSVERVSPTERDDREGRYNPDGGERNEWLPPLDNVIETFQQAGRFEPVLQRDGERDPPPYGQASTEGRRSQGRPFSEVRAALDAWEALAPQSLGRDNLPSSVATYVEVQTGGRPTLGLSVEA